jgi:hypothetical protein
MEVGSGGWPWPKEWGTPKVIPDRARIDNEAAAQFMAHWATMQIRKRQRAAGPTTPAAAQARLRLLAMRYRLLDGR